MTLPEVMLWQGLRRRRGSGLRFRRQHPVGRYILDFYCDALKLAVEVDGWSHNTGDRPERDIARDLWLAERGIRVMRIPADEVIRDATGVVDGIVALAHDSPLRPSGPLPPEGED